MNTKRTLLLTAILLCAQNSYASEPTTLQFNLHPGELQDLQAQLESVREQLKPPLLSPTIRAFGFKIPPRYTGEQRDNIQSLLEELSRACPDCADGGSIGGNTIIGGNTGGAPLFGPLCRCKNDCSSGDKP